MANSEECTFATTKKLTVKQVGRQEKDETPRPTYENEKQAPSDRYENHDIKFQLLKVYN